MFRDKIKTFYFHVRKIKKHQTSHSRWHPSTKSSVTRQVRNVLLPLAQYPIPTGNDRLKMMDSHLLCCMNISSRNHVRSHDRSTRGHMRSFDHKTFKGYV